MNKNCRAGILLVANWDSGVGYAWWLMESFWEQISKKYSHSHDCFLVFPSISTIPDLILKADITCHKEDFTKVGFAAVLRQCIYLWRHKIRMVYFSDNSSRHWRYILFRLIGVKTIVIHDHTPGLRTVPVGAKKYIKTLLSNLPFINCDGIIGVSEYIRERAIKVACFPKAKVYVAANGLRPLGKVEAIDLHHVFGIPTDARIIVTTGRATKYKGIDFAIKCMAELAHQHKREDFHWVFCGDGEELEEFRALVKELEITKFTSLVGKRSDVASILAGSDIAFHPSLGEVGYSLSILEYMQAGMPVVVSDNPSVCGATIDNETGLIYKEQNINSAVQSFITLLDDNVLLKKLGNNSKDAVKQYSLDNTHKSLLDALSRLYSF